VNGSKKTGKTAKCVADLKDTVSSSKYITQVQPNDLFEFF